MTAAPGHVPPARRHAEGAGWQDCRSCGCGSSRHPRSAVPSVAPLSRLGVTTPPRTVGARSSVIQHQSSQSSIGPSYRSRRAGESRRRRFGPCATRAPPVEGGRRVRPPRSRRQPAARAGVEDDGEVDDFLQEASGDGVSWPAGATPIAARASDDPADVERLRVDASTEDACVAKRVATWKRPHREPVRAGTHGNSR